MSKAQGKFDFSVHHPFKHILNITLNVINTSSGFGEVCTTSPFSLRWHYWLGSG